MRIRKWKLDKGISIALWPGGGAYLTDLRVYDQAGSFIGATADKRNLRAIANAILEALVNEQYERTSE